VVEDHLVLLVVVEVLHKIQVLLASDLQDLSLEDRVASDYPFQLVHDDLQIQDDHVGLADE
jgi:hypothetical protein